MLRLFCSEFGDKYFTHVIIDEAAQCSECEAMIPISCIDLDRGQVIMAGDPLQLPPISLSNHARHYKLVKSMLERYVDTYKTLNGIEVVSIFKFMIEYKENILFNVLLHSFSPKKMGSILVWLLGCVETIVSECFGNSEPTLNSKLYHLIICKFKVRYQAFCTTTTINSIIRHWFPQFVDQRAQKRSSCRY